jgi:tRNA U34 5-carboxymethylaminomethyl modifying enzyme MnmG/GidA
LINILLLGWKAGVVSATRYERYKKMESELERGLELLNRFELSPQRWVAHGIAVSMDGVPRR